MPKPLLTPAVTPVESSEDEDEKPAYPFPCTPRLRSSPLNANSAIHIDEAMDSDMDMADSQPPTSPAPWNKIASPKHHAFALLPLPGSRNAQDSVNGGRIPTPIYGHFRSIDTSMDVDAPEKPGGSTFSQSRQELDHESHLRRRRLPTPISEDEAMESPSITTEDVLNRFDTGIGFYEHQPPSERRRKIQTTEVALGAPISRGPKMTLSMGYRADCEKCRMKVPGHYNHVVRG